MGGESFIKILLHIIVYCLLFTYWLNDFTDLLANPKTLSLIGKPVRAMTISARLDAGQSDHEAWAVELLSVVVY